MAAPISVQLHSLREQMRDGRHLEVLAQVAAMGYRGVECAGFHGLGPAGFAAAARDLGLAVSANHTACPTRDTLAECIDIHHALGTRFVVCGFWDDEYRSVEAIGRTAARLDQVIAPLAAAGLTLVLHNHWQEFARVDGRLAYDHLVEACPRIRFEIDAYWAAGAGDAAAAELVGRFKERTPLLQLKDGPLGRGRPHTAIGAGALDIPAIVAAADPAVLEWVVVELGSCATGVIQAVADSYAWLVGRGLASGTKPISAAG
jgi:sugar phosphate isomerase/epimerase